MFTPHWRRLKAERSSNLFSGDLLLPTVLAGQGKLQTDVVVGLKSRVREHESFLFALQFACRSNTSAPVWSHLDVFKMEGEFAVFAVKRSGFTFSLVMSVPLRTKDRGLAGFALDPLQFAATFVLSLKRGQRCFSTTFRLVGQVSQVSY